MKKLIFTLAILSLTSDLYAETTVPAHTTATVQSIKIYSDTVPQDMSQTQYQALLQQNPVVQPSAEQIAISTTKREFSNRVYRAWQLPVGKSGEKALAFISLTADGQVSSIMVQATDPEVKTSVERAIRAAAPFPMPNDPEARQFARTFKVNFTVK